MCGREGTQGLPSQGSGSVLAARSSMENLISMPFSNRDSGSAFMSQYWRPSGAGGVEVVVGLVVDLVVFLVTFLVVDLVEGFILIRFF